MPKFIPRKLIEKRMKDYISGTKVDAIDPPTEDAMARAVGYKDRVSLYRVAERDAEPIPDIKDQMRELINDWVVKHGFWLERNEMQSSFTQAYLTRYAGWGKNVVKLNADLNTKVDAKIQTVELSQEILGLVDKLTSNE